MSVESQTAGGGGPDVCYTDEIERPVTPDERYVFLKDEFSSVSSTSELHSDILLSKSKSYSDCGSSLQVFCLYYNYFFFYTTSIPLQRYIYCLYL